MGPFNCYQVNIEVSNHNYFVICARRNVYHFLQGHIEIKI